MPYKPSDAILFPVVPQPDPRDSTIHALTAANDQLRDEFLNILSENGRLQAANESKRILLAQTYEVLVNSITADSYTELIAKIAQELRQ